MKKRIVKIIAILVLLTVVVFGVMWGCAEWALHHFTYPKGTGEDESREIETASTEEGQQTEPQQEEEDLKEYPAPDYDFKKDEIYVEIKGLKRDYKIAVVNDIHMITDHQSGDVTEDNLSTVLDRYENFSVTEDGVHAEELWPEIVKFLNYNDFDAVVFAGDLLDYCSNSNILRLNEGIRELKYPKDKMMYLRSDHDYGGWYGGSSFTDTKGFILQTYILDGDKEEKRIEFDDFVIIGFNKSYRNISESALEAMEKKLQGDKPVIVATHVPFYSDVDESLAERSMEVRNRIYYWSREDSSYDPDERTQQLIDDMYDRDTNVVQIVGAHLHADWDGYVSENVKEHIFAPAFQGNIGIIYVTGGNGENEKGLEKE